VKVGALVGLLRKTGVKRIADIKAGLRVYLDETIDFLDRVGREIEDANRQIDELQKWFNQELDRRQKQLEDLNREREEAEQFLRNMRKLLGEDR